MNCTIKTTVNDEELDDLKYLAELCEDGIIDTESGDNAAKVIRRLLASRDS